MTPPPPETVDALSGRHLDLAVARYVFGHQVEERPNLQTGEMDAVFSASLRTSNATWVRVPFYTRPGKPARLVEAELLKRGWKKKQDDAAPDEELRVVLERADGRTVAASGEASEALCRAALKAMQL
jgi:hypothetical protein